MVSCEQVASHLGATWRQVYKDYVTESDLRNDLIAEVCEYAVKPCMVFVTQLRHGRTLRTRLRQAGFKVDMAHGEDHIQNRRHKLQRMVERSTDIIVATSIFQEGIDVPELRSVVNAAGGASEVAAIQRLGRGMRRSAGKDCFELWDIFDHGQLWLERHSLARKCAYESEGHTVEVIT
jgi:superfamily II DNA or RNA helicase